MRVNNNNDKYENAHRADTADITHTRTQSVGLDGDRRSSAYGKLQSENERCGKSEGQNCKTIKILSIPFFFLGGGRESRPVISFLGGEMPTGIQ